MKTMFPLTTIASARFEHSHEQIYMNANIHIKRENFKIRSKC